MSHEYIKLDFICFLYFVCHNSNSIRRGILLYRSCNVTTIYMTQENMHPQSLGRLSQEKCNVMLTTLIPLKWL